MQGTDFAILDNGELELTNGHDIKAIDGDELRIQMAYARIKSVSTTWYIDEIGADLEALIGRHCNETMADEGKSRIIDSLTFDKLWDEDDIYIKAKIEDNVTIRYLIYLRTYQSYDEDTVTTEIEVTLDLIKGVKIRYGWEPRR